MSTKSKETMDPKTKRIDVLCPGRPDLEALVRGQVKTNGIHAALIREYPVDEDPIANLRAIQRQLDRQIPTLRNLFVPKMTLEERNLLVRLLNNLKMAQTAAAHLEFALENPVDEDDAIRVDVEWVREINHAS